MIVTERVEAIVPDGLQGSQARFPPWQFSEVSLMPNEKLPRPLVSNPPAMTRISDWKCETGLSSQFPSTHEAEGVACNARRIGLRSRRNNLAAVTCQNWLRAARFWITGLSS